MKTFATRLDRFFIGFACALLWVVPMSIADDTSPLVKAFGAELVNMQGETISTDYLSGKTIGLYFSAQWCPPCRTFTPILVQAYEELKLADKPFELIFVSHDRSEEAMFKYMQDYDMSWLAIPFASPIRDLLKQQHEIRGIPTLIIVNDKGEVITRNGRGDVTAQGAAAFERW